MSVVDYLLNSLIRRLQKAQKTREKTKKKKRLAAKLSRKAKKAKSAKKRIGIERRKRDRGKKRTPGRPAKSILKKPSKLKKKKSVPRKAAVRPKAKKVKKVRKVKKVVKKVFKAKKTTNEILVGEVTHFFSGIKVIVLKMNNGKLLVGDQIHIQGKTVNFVQKVKSLQIESVDVKSARKGQLVGLKVSKKARPGDQVFKLVA